VGAFEVEPDTPALDRLASLAEEQGAARIAREARELSRRTSEGRFFVTCVGQLKRGKSTLLNALLEDPVLPVGVVPVTSVVTVVRHGAAREAHVQLHDGRQLEIAPEQLVDYVSEERNPGNRKRVSAIEVTLPSPVLRCGMCLVDTPGIGSVFAGNSEATRAFVPHLDAALVVLGADPPISGDELSLILEVAGQAPNLVFVLNKADKLPDDERRQAAAFTQRVLAERLGRPIGPLLEVSAVERQPARDWPRLVHALTMLAEGSGAKLVAAAQRRGLARLAAELQHELDERRGALLRPIEESERRLAALEGTVAAAEQSMVDLGTLLAAEQQRLARSFEARLQEFLATIPELRAELSAALPGRRSEALDLAGRFARERIDGWHAQIGPVADELYSGAMERFVALANDFLARASGVALAPLDAEAGFRVPARARFTEMLWLNTRTPLGVVADLVRGRRGLRTDAEGYVEQLLETNANRVASDLNERVAQSRGRLEVEIRARLYEVSAVSRRALQGAARSRAAGEPAVRAELARIDTALAALEAIRG
jgi:hypothetical protein